MDDEFEDWFLANEGFIHSNVEIAWDETYGVHMRVGEGEELPPDSLVVSCPHNLTISWLNVIQGSETFLSQFDLDEAYYSVNQVVIVRFFILNEYLKREKSFWHPYLRSLPQPGDKHFSYTPMWYEVGDWPWIRGTDIERVALRTEEQWGKEYEHAMASLTPSAKASTKDWSWTLYKWASTIMGSRSFPSSALANSTVGHALKGTKNVLYKAPDASIEPGSPILIPGIDILNHWTLAQVTWQWGSLSCRLVNNEKILSGSQVFNNYGPKGNTELLMGYGFVLHDNPADHCVLSLARASVDSDGAHAELTAVRGKRHLLASEMNENGNYQRDSVPWVRLYNKVLDKGRDDARAPVTFSPGFLHDTAVALANKRERASCDFWPVGQVDISTQSLSRNKFKVLCAVAMLVQERYASIVQHNSDLPRSPANQKQIYADRYRRDQLHILKSVSVSLLEQLASLAGLRIPNVRDRRVLRMEQMLRESPKPLMTDFRAALNAGLGTRNAGKIRERGWTECAFTLWVCAVWLWGTAQSRIIQSQRSQACGSSEIHGMIQHWLSFLKETYRDPPPVRDAADFAEWRQLAGLADHDLSLAHSFLEIVNSATRKHPESLFNATDCTQERLLWCLQIVREESVMAPNLEGKPGDDKDELILFLECKDEDIGLVSV